MTGPGHDSEGDDEVHVDPISEVQAEFEADAPDLEPGFAHRAHAPDGRHRRVLDEGDDADESTSRPPAPPTVAPDTIGSEPPPNDRADRQRFLVLYLRVALVVAFVVGVLELVLPVEARDEAATVMVVVFIAAPIGRVVWLMVRWARLGDWRFALVGAVLLAVVATSFLAR